MFALVLVLSFSAIGESAQAQTEPPSNTPGAWHIYPDATEHWVGNDRIANTWGSDNYCSIHAALGYSGQLLSPDYQGPNDPDRNWKIRYWEFYNPPPEGTIIELRGSGVWTVGGDGAQGGQGREKMKSLVMRQPGITLRGQDYDDGTGNMVQQEIYSPSGATTAIIYAEAADLTIENLHIQSEWKGMYGIAILRYPVTHSAALTYDYDLGQIVIGPVPVEPAPGLTVKDCTMNNLRAPFDYHCIFEDATIVDNTVNNCYYNLIKKGGYFQGDNTITGNSFNHVGEGKSYPALQILGHTGTTCIDYNTFNGWASGQYAIKVEVDISAHPINLGENNVYVDQVGGSGAGYGLYPLTSGGHAVGATSEDDIIEGCGPSLVPMSEFTIDHAKLDFKKSPDNGKVSVKGKLALDPAGDGVNITEDVIVTVGLLSQTITMVDKDGKWEYKRPKGGTGIIKKMKIDWKKGRFEFSMDKADLSGLTDPNKVIISTQIGDDFGKQTIQMREKDSKWDYKAK